VSGQPKLTREAQRLDTGLRPPIELFAGAVQVTVMGATQRHRELVADLCAQPARLGKPKMVGVARLSAADEAGLFGHEAQVLAIALAPLLGQGEGAAVAVIGALRFVLIGWTPGSFRQVLVCRSQMGKPRCKGSPDLLAIERDQGVRPGPRL